MADTLKVRIRDGCRGGSEHFKWNSIKDQEFKDREQYLGASTKVGMMTKFARYYVHDWYAKKRETVESIDSERNAVQAYEEELMQEALGIKPKKLLLSKRQLTEDEMKDLLRREDDKGSDKKGREAMGPQKKVVANEHGEQVATSNEGGGRQGLGQEGPRGHGPAEEGRRQRARRAGCHQQRGSGRRGRARGADQGHWVRVPPDVEAGGDQGEDPRDGQLPRGHQDAGADRGEARGGQRRVPRWQQQQQLRLAHQGRGRRGQARGQRRGEAGGAGGRGERGRIEEAPDG
mmetsp:Transcript_56134/g.174047  ORF Transcript_56134/g.174047 Transcript_56134/m.174047 type:complete len:289 (-) Transcript_56134:309-1175(-)